MRSIREVMAMMPELQRFRAWLESDTPATEEQLAEARAILAQPERQRDLFGVRDGR